MTAPPAVPVVLVTGDDPVLRSEGLSAAVAAAVGTEDPSLAAEEVGGAGEDPLDIGAVLDACLTPPFFTDRKVVVVRDAGRLDAGGVERLLAYLAEPLPTTTLVLAAGGGRLSPKVGAAVKQAGGTTVATGVTPTPKGRSEWLTGRLHDSGLRFDAPAGRLLGEHLGEDVGRLPGILAALRSAYGDGARIGPDELEPFLGAAGGVAPWDLTDAIDAGRTEVALDALRRLLGAGERHPLVVLATLHRHYAGMLRLDGSGARTEAAAADLLGMKPFPARKILQQGRALGGDRIGRAILLLAEADLDLRGAKAWPGELVLEVLVARLSRLAPHTTGAGRRR